MYVQRNERVRVTIVAVERLYIFYRVSVRVCVCVCVCVCACACVCVALVIHHAMRMSRIISSYVARGSNTFLQIIYIISYMAQFSEKRFLNKKCVLIF